jgi:alpha-ketoglutarate-dependent taurine dioxygenase
VGEGENFSPTKEVKMPNYLKPFDFNQIFSSDKFEFTDLFKNEFESKGVVLLRDFKCNLQTQEKITNNFKNLYPELFCIENSPFYYEENHQYTIDMRNEFGLEKAGDDDIFIVWHMEMIGYPNPATGATWNMKKFNCSTESGKTYFYDAIQLFSRVSQKDLQVLKKCRYVINVDSIKDERSVRLKYNSYCPIKQHSFLKKNLIYIDPSNNYKIIECGQHEMGECQLIFDSLIYKIKEDKENLIIHKWQENDFLFVDLSRMYHAVTGGFNPAQRQFDGFWLHSFPGSKYGNILV